METYPQWYYILGYGIVVVGHNWPLLVCLCCGFWHAARLYRAPAATEVRRLYGWCLLGFAYEYDKHLRAIVAEVIDALLAWHYWHLNRPAHLLAELALAGIIVGALWMFWQGYLRAPVVARIPPRPERPRAER